MTVMRQYYNIMKDIMTANSKPTTCTKFSQDTHYLQCLKYLKTFNTAENMEIAAKMHPT